uniref:ATP-dependent RNA helicase n=1 Tax=Panagrolaimus sp. PS1159 TaxID=55785 RepID=A0AC35FXM6_9BILA
KTRKITHQQISYHPKRPPRISSLKESIVQKQNPPDFHKNFNQNSIEKPFSHNSTTFNKSPENGQKKLKKAIISNYFSDSADSGFNDAFATLTKEYNSPPSQNSNDCVKTFAAATSKNYDDQKEKEEENEKPAFHKYFKVNPSPSIKKPFHSNAQGRNNNGYNNKFRERNVHPIFGSRNFPSISRIGGFSSTVNDHLKFNPTPKIGNKYQQLDDNSKINIASEAQKNSSAEKNSTQNGKTIVESGFEITVSDGKILPKFENWKEMNLNQKLLENIQESNFQQPLNIQKSVISYIQNRYNVKYESNEIGIGKTGTYIIPLIDNLIKDKETQKFPNNGPICLIISPTRESAHQIYEQVQKFANGTGITVGYCYGENNTAQNLSKLRNFGCNILCACFGRLMNFVESGNISLDSIKYLVIEKAEKFIGSKFDMENGILKLLNYPLLPSKENRQTILSSATLRDPVVSKFADKNVHSKKQVFISNKYQLLNVTNNQAKDSASYEFNE